jgi:uncharacterized protein (DUF433 family)
VLGGNFSHGSKRKISPQNSHLYKEVKMTEPIVVKDPEILGGIPVFRGTRVPVQNLIDYLTTGETIDAFLDDFPTVRREQVVQFLERAGAVADENSD